MYAWAHLWGLSFTAWAFRVCMCDEHVMRQSAGLIAFFCSVNTTMSWRGRSLCTSVGCEEKLKFYTIYLNDRIDFSNWISFLCLSLFVSVCKCCVAGICKPHKTATQRENQCVRIKKPTWDGAQQHVVFNAAVNIVVALWFEGWPRRQDGVERVEIVCFHCSEKENAQHWHRENTIHTQVTFLIKVGWWLFVSVLLGSTLCLVFSRTNHQSSVLTHQINTHYFLFVWCSSSICEGKLLDVSASVSVHGCPTQNLCGTHSTCVPDAALRHVPWRTPGENVFSSHNCWWLVLLHADVKQHSKMPPCNTTHTNTFTVCS